MKKIYHLLRPHAGQFGLYLLSGGSGTLLAAGSFKLLLILGVPYQIGALLTNALGTLYVFLFNKYAVFRKKQHFGKHSVRYALLTGFNFVAQYLLIIAFVEFFRIDPVIAQLLSVACAVSWNFLLYKFFVYV